MNELFNTILNNFVYIGAVLSLIVIFECSNMFFGIVDNVVINKEKFEWSKILNWLLKSIGFILGVCFMTGGVSLIPFIIEYVGVTIPSEYGEVITMALIITASYKAVYREMMKAYEHFKNIIDKE